jgi:hypothetical protein
VFHLAAPIMDDGDFASSGRIPTPSNWSLSPTYGRLALSWACDV